MPVPAPIMVYTIRELRDACAMGSPCIVRVMAATRLVEGRDDTLQIDRTVFLDGNNLLTLVGVMARQEFGGRYARPSD